MDTRPRAAIVRLSAQLPSILSLINTIQEGDLIDNTAFLATATTESFSDEEEEVVVKKDLARMFVHIHLV